MTLHSGSGLSSCCNFVSCFCWLHCTGTKRRAWYRGPPGKTGCCQCWRWQFDCEEFGHICHFRYLAKTGGLFHFASGFLGSEFLRRRRENTSWTIWFLPGFWLHGSNVSFPNSASRKDPQVLLADSTMRSPSFASQKSVLEHHDSSR